MAICENCFNRELCNSISLNKFGVHIIPQDECCNFKDRSRFVELTTARKIKQTPDSEIMKEFHKLGFGKGMSERSIFWICSNCKMWTSLAYTFCPNCGAKFEAEQALKERENNENNAPIT